MQHTGDGSLKSDPQVGEEDEGHVHFRLVTKQSKVLSVCRDLPVIKHAEQFSCLHRASMIIKHYYPTNAQYIICRYN